jgi:hypothetical protein
MIVAPNSAATVKCAAQKVLAKEKDYENLMLIQERPVS